MNFKKILCLVVAVAFMLPALVEGKPKKIRPLRGKLVSITETEIVVKLRKEEKNYTITEETKILNEKGQEVKAEEFKATMVILKTDPEDAEKVTEIKALPARKPKAPKKKKPAPAPEEEME